MIWLGPSGCRHSAGATVAREAVATKKQKPDPDGATPEAFATTTPQRGTAPWLLALFGAVCRSARHVSLCLTQVTPDMTQLGLSRACLQSSVLMMTARAHVSLVTSPGCQHFVKSRNPIGKNSMATTRLLMLQSNMPFYLEQGI